MMQRWRRRFVRIGPRKAANISSGSKLGKCGTQAPSDPVRSLSKTYSTCTDTSRMARRAAEMGPSSSALTRKIPVGENDAS